MSCASRGRTSCYRFESHPQGPALGDSFLQGKSKKTENLVSPAERGLAHLTDIQGGVCALSLRLQRGHLHIQFMFLSRESTSVTCLLPAPRDQVYEIYLLPSILINPQTSIFQVSRQYPKAHSRSLVGLCCCWLQLAVLPPDPN